VLLATLIGFPTESPALFETLYRRARSLPATTWAEFVDELEPQFTGDKQWANACGKWSQAQARSWAALTSALRDVHNAAEDTDRVGSPSLNLPCPLAAWAEWVVPVGRLSFHTGQVVAELDRRPALNESGDYEKTSQPSQNSNIPIRASDLR
jgi:hypothetical protein